MAFRSFKYLNTDRLAEYSEILAGRMIKEKSSVAKKVSAKLNLGVVGASAEAESNSELQVTQSDSASYDLFEKMIASLDGESYFDFLRQNDWDIHTLPPMSLFRTSGYLAIPEAFDMLAAFQEFIPMLKAMGQLNLEGDQAANEFALSLFSGTDAAIPVVITGNEIPIASKLDSRFILGLDYQNLEDLAEEEATILCKVVGYPGGNKVPIFDPLKDFVRLNRILRRNIERTSDLSIITLEGPVLKAEVIAVYN
jgi:hypothetical protein